MRPLERFLDLSFVSLKICGVTMREDAEQLVTLGVDALGVNFWPRSKRFLAPENAVWLREFAGRILRVGVFVNEASELPLRLIREGLLDVVQVHGDETPEDVAIYRESGVPFFKGIGVKTPDDLKQALVFGASALLLDAHAPGVYGGTGETFDWNAAVEFKSRHPQLPVILAGGIVPENAADAAAVVRPAALDVASGAEISPGVKDFDKVAALLAAIRTNDA
ncbi:MAG: phosphoribosylanthranilate isomerase [Verrucomicrobiota bacterium]